mgnify:CR=1 FL=1|jgi:hypothetical protein
MGVEMIQWATPLWVSKLSDDKLKQYLDDLNELKLNRNDINRINNELLLSTAKTWYCNYLLKDKIISLAHDVYAEAAIRWYNIKFENELERNDKNGNK